MMTTTHALFGALLGAATAPLAPGLTPSAVAAGFVGGALPDADLLASHRRSTHFPVCAAAVGGPTAAAALLVGTPTATLLAVFALAAATHCLMDVFGGGLEHRPWEATSEKGVYDHVNGRWIRPRRWVRYAGAPEDFLLATAFAAPVLAVTSGRLRWAIAAVLVASGLFVAVRRRLPPLAERVFGDHPAGK
jgi:hypothetical protein